MIPELPLRGAFDAGSECGQAVACPRSARAVFNRHCLVNRHAWSHIVCSSQPLRLAPFWPKSSRVDIYLALDVDAARPIVHCRDVRRILAYNHRALQLEGSSQLCILASEHEVVRQNRELLHLGSVRDSVLRGSTEPEQSSGVSSISVRALRECQSRERKETTR